MGATISSVSSRSSVFSLVASGDALDLGRVPDVGMALRNFFFFLVALPRSGQATGYLGLQLNIGSGSSRVFRCVMALVLDAGRSLRRSQLPPFECVTGRGSLQATGDALNLERVTGRTFGNAHHLP